MEPQVGYDWEPDSVDCAIGLVGAGAAVPTRPTTSRNNYTITRTGTGVIKITFADDFGPTFQGIIGYAFGDTTAATNVLGWSVAGGAFVARSGTTPASFTFTIGNASNAAADLATTSTLVVTLSVKQGPGIE